MLDCSERNYNRFKVVMSDNEKLIFGYWALRGKAHTIRLVMEYLEIPYQDVMYRTPQSWYEDSFSKQNKGLDLPYLIDQDFVFDETVPILTYILKKYGHQKFLGQSIQEQAHVDMYMWSMQNVFKKLIAMSLRGGSIQEMIKFKQQYWRTTFEPKLQALQNFLRPGSWFLDYITVIDFDLHQVMSYIRILFPSKIGMFPKIQQIQKKIASLPSIKSYSNSQKYNNLCFLPVQMCKRFKSSSAGN